MITKAQAARFAKTLERLRQGSCGTAGVHPRIVQAQADAIRSQLADLEREMREYETLRAGGYKLEKLSVVDELATVLIKARIGQGLSQKELAERIGVKEQQIQRYEATDYATASLARIREVPRERVGGEGLTRLLRAGGRLLEERGESVGL